MALGISSASTMWPMYVKSLRCLSCLLTEPQALKMITKVEIDLAFQTVSAHHFPVTIQLNLPYAITASKGEKLHLRVQ